ncbi:kinesin-like protein KIF24 [Chaetodon trifascialis]|uniref:kinesin-like protein KIF24 n=1 Tax=Chaetodon trifascialis TaxID=109706 RepID=UPI0039920131
MTLGLFECLRAVGLQRHYARFNSVGIRRVTHLSGLTMEDYPLLGICSMEERTQLFHLVQVVKTLDLESLEYEDYDDYDYNTGSGDEGYAVVDNSVTFYGCGDPDEDVYDNDNDEKGAAVSKLNVASFSKPSRICRRLDFSCETVDYQQKLFSNPVGTVHVYANHNNEPGQGKGSDIPVQFELDTGSAVVCSCKGHNNHRPHVSSHQSDHHTGANTKPDIMEGISMDNCHTRLSPKRVSSHKPKPRPATAASKRFTNKPVGHKDRKGISQKEKLHTEIRSNMASEHMTKPTPVYESKATAGYNYGLPLSSPPAPSKKQSGGQQISVCVRKRPLTRAECRRGEADVVTTLRGDSVIVHESKEAVDLTQYILQHRFYFDQVFGEETSNAEVYRRTAHPLVQHMLNGGKATCFAYGQTGAGKTHTMLGSSPGRPGLYALAVQDIFAHLSATHTHSRLLVYVSFFEIYCGQLYDLLDHRKRLFAREDGQKVVHIAGLRDVRVDSVSSLLEVISQGTEERTQGTSGVNPLSSRSHALLQIQLRGPNQQIAGRMWFVDLAGSERASDSKEPDRQSRMEGAEINQSLLALKECIRSLDQEQSHTPFRQSKLTLVLKDSFVGDSMTCMIANISPGHPATEHTLNTLRYADRVKELRGQGGQRGGRRGKTIPSPKRNLSNSNSSSRGSSVGTRGKSSPKKPKLGRQREAFCPTTLTSRLAAGGTILCSTPKNSRWEEETSARARNGIGLEEITPIRCSLQIGDKTERRQRTGGREGRGRERYGGADSAGHPIVDQNIRSGLILAQETDEQLHLSEVQRESGFYCREKEDQQSTLKGGRDGERRWLEQRRQVESSRDMCTEVERLRERHLQKTDERDEERERHLRQYHQQLQQFMPSSASSSDHLFSPSTCLSFSSSNQASFSSSAPPSSCSSLQHSPLKYDGLEELYRARVKIRTDGNRGQLSSLPSREICLQTATSPSHSNNEDEVGQGDSGGISEDVMLSLEGTEAGFQQDSGKSEKRRSLKARVEGERRERREDWRPAAKEGGGERRWAWVATAQTEQAERMTGARPADVEAQVFYDCDSEVGEEGLDASAVPADGVWSTEEQEGHDGYALVSTHRRNDSSSLCDHSPVESPHQRAPAERPLSPACEHTNTLLTPNKLSDLSPELKHTRCTSNILPPLVQSTQQGVPSSSHREKEPWFAANANGREFSNAQPTTLPLIIPIIQNGCKIPAEPLNIKSENSPYSQVHNHPEVKAKMSVLSQGEASTDSLSYTMDPLSISLLQVDQEVATASFLQGEKNSTSLYLLENERGENKRKEVEEEHLTCAEVAGEVVEDEDVEFRLSLLELPHAMTRCPPTSDTMTATDHFERRKGPREQSETPNHNSH